MKDNRFRFLVVAVFGLYLANILQILQNELILQNVFRRMMSGTEILFSFALATILFVMMVVVGGWAIADVAKDWWQEGDDA